jgi:hypothetical protein
MADAINASRWLKRSVLSAIVVLVGGCHEPSNLPTAPTVAATTHASPLTVTGTVRDLLQRPIGGAHVEVADGPLAGLSATTDDQGQYSLNSSSPSPDLVTLVVSKEGYAPASSSVRNRSQAVIFLKDAGFADLAGRGRVTFVADASCTQLPPTLRRRSYDALIEETTSSAWAMTVALSGADLFDHYDTMSMGRSSDTVRFSVFSWDAFMWWLEDLPIIERVTPTGHLALSGSALAPFTNAQQTIAARFDGTVSFCSESMPASNPQFPPTCAVEPVQCVSAHHQLTLTR